MICHLNVFISNMAKTNKDRSKYHVAKQNSAKDDIAKLSARKVWEFRIKFYIPRMQSYMLASVILS